MKKLGVVFGVVVVLILAGICVPIYAPVAAEIEAEDVGLLDSGYYQITSFDGDYGFGVAYIGFGCASEYEFHCVDGDLVEPPPVGRWCVKIGNQKLDCDLEIVGVQKYHDYQTIRRDKTTSHVCGLYLPNVVKEPQPVCGCKGYSVKVKRDSTQMFELPMLPAPEYGIGGTIRVTAPQVVTVNYRWNGDVVGMDPCLKSYELKIQCPSFSKTLVGKDSQVKYDCGTMNYSTTACTALATVQLTTGEVCQSKWQTIDP